MKGFLLDHLNSLWLKIQKMHRSWTMRFNGIMATIALSLPDLLQTVPSLQPYVPADIYRWMMIFTLTGNIILRFKTNRSLADK